MSGLAAGRPGVGTDSAGAQGGGLSWGHWRKGTRKVVARKRERGKCFATFCTGKGERGN